MIEKCSVLKYKNDTTGTRFTRKNKGKGRDVHVTNRQIYEINKISRDN